MRARSLTVWAVIIAGLIAATLSADFTDDLAPLLPDGEPRLARQLSFFKARGATELIVLEAWSERPDGLPTTVARTRTLVEALAPTGARPIAGSAGDVAAAIERVLDHLPALVVPADLAAIETRMSGAPLRAWLQEVKARASRPDEVFAGAAVRHDVLALSGGVLGDLVAHLPAGRPVDGLIAHNDGKHVLALLEVDFPPSDLARTRVMLDVVAAHAATAVADGVRIEPIGSYRHFRENIEGIFSDLIATAPLGLALIILLLWSLVRSWRDLTALHLPALIAFLAAVATLALPGLTAPQVMLGFAACFLGVAVENAIHMTLALQRGAAASVRRPLIESFLTTAVAFAALWLSNVPALRLLGLMVVVGLMAAMAASLTLLPALVRARPPREPWRAIASRLLRFAEGRPAPRLIAAAIITALAVPGLMRLEFMSDLRRMDGSKPETWVALEAFLERWGGYEASDFLVADHADLDAALASARAARAALALPPTSVERLLPDRAERDRRVAAWNAFWRERGPAFATEFGAACIDVGLVARAFQASLERYRPIDQAPAVALDTWRGTHLEHALGTFVVRTGSAADAPWQVATPLAGLDAPAVAAVADRLDETGAGAWVASRARMASTLVDAVRDDLMRLGLYMGAAMLTLIVIMERRPRRVVAVAAPAVLALCWTFGALGWMGVPLTAFTVLVGAFIAGIGIDAGVFLAGREHRAAALAPALACAGSTALGTASLMAAANPLVANVGTASVIGMITCIAACLLVTPAIAGRDR
ncbi:MAG TPA: hypothetical protein VEL07_10440 [Planctomycetota bacterium]|nr:hypothetical protein [Planctomycetota bacterium]